MLLQSGRLRALGVTGAKRTAAAPGILTLIEAGVPGYTVTSWYGLLAPAATPQGVISRLNGELVKVLRLPDLRDRLAGQGAEPAAGTPGEFHAFLKDEIAKWGKVVKAANISAE